MSTTDDPFTTPVRWAAVASRAVASKDRRLEGATYLEDGYGLRLSITGRETGWVPMQAVATVWQPSRLKGITTEQEFGVPFFSAGQMFEERPSPRKWLVAAATPNMDQRKVSSGQLLLSCSGVVGNAMVATSTHEGAVVTHDLLRIDPKEPALSGWLYGYMRTPLFKKMASSARYGHMIKHLEPEHVESMPFIVPDKDQQEQARVLFEKVLQARESSICLASRAHDLITQQLQYEPLEQSHHTTVLSAEVRAGRRRLDAEHFRPRIADIKSAMTLHSARIDRLSDLTERIWWPNRFKRTFSPFGTPYVSASEVFDRVTEPTKFIFESLVADADEYKVEPGWILMARSGQVYGLNGRVKMATERLNGVFVSEDLIRIVADPAKIDSAYLLASLSHPAIGRPLVIRNAYGTSIPHLEPRDILDVPIARFAADIEQEIGRIMKAAADAAAEAEVAEVALIAHVERSCAPFLRDSSE